MIIEDKIIHNEIKIVESKKVRKVETYCAQLEQVIENNFEFNFGKEKGNSIIYNCIKW